MVEIREGQKRIREGQKESRKRTQEIIEQVGKLKEETDVISKQSSENQLRVHLMFRNSKSMSGEGSCKKRLDDSNVTVCHPQNLCVPVIILGKEVIKMGYAFAHYGHYYQ